MNYRVLNTSTDSGSFRDCATLLRPRQNEIYGLFTCTARFQFYRSRCAHKEQKQQKGAGMRSSMSENIRTT